MGSRGISDEVIEKIKSPFFEPLGCNVSKGMALMYLPSVPVLPQQIFLRSHPPTRFSEHWQSYLTAVSSSLG